MLFNVVFLLVASIVVQGSRGEDCSSRFARCRAESRFLELLDDKDYNSAKEKMDEICPSVKNGLKCIEDEAKRCLTEEMLEGFMQVLHKFNVFLKEACDEDSPIGKALLENFQCIDNFIYYLDDPCFDEVYDAVYEYDRDSSLNNLVKRAVRRSDDYEDYLKSEVCLKQSASKVCEVHLIAKECGPGARALAVASFRKLGYPFLDVSCSAERFELYLDAMEVYERKNQGNVLRELRSIMLK